LVQIFFSEPCSQTPSVYALLLAWEAKFHTHTKQLVSGCTCPQKRLILTTAFFFLQLKTTDTSYNDMAARKLIRTSSSRPSLWNGSSVSSAAGSNSGTDILKSRVGRSAIVPDFQIHPGNGNLLAVVPFSETRWNHKGSPRRVRRVEDHSHVLGAKNCCNDRAVCAGALSWWVTQSCLRHRSKRCRLPQTVQNLLQ
jgi:hypothetical protein